MPEIEESLHGERSDTGGDQGKSKVGVVGDEEVIRPEEKWLGVDGREADCTLGVTAVDRRAHMKGKREGESPKKPRGEEDENAGEGAQARRRVIHFDIEQIFLQLYDLTRAAFNYIKHSTWHSRPACASTHTCMMI